ncbi:hypothetical protein AYO22_05025 [Fonsecaea multimorphosa]|nr:hypothetical protein AYO22_05025 [Fonsecaea multimorphosa]
MPEVSTDISRKFMQWSYMEEPQRKISHPSSGNWDQPRSEEYWHWLNLNPGYVDFWVPHYVRFANPFEEKDTVVDSWMTVIESYPELAKERKRSDLMGLRVEGVKTGDACHFHDHETFDMLEEKIKKKIKKNKKGKEKTMMEGNALGLIWDEVPRSRHLK